MVFVVLFDIGESTVNRQRPLHRHFEAVAIAEKYRIGDGMFVGTKFARAFYELRRCLHISAPQKSGSAEGVLNQLRSFPPMRGRSYQLVTGFRPAQLSWLQKVFEHGAPKPGRVSRSMCILRMVRKTSGSARERR